MPCIRISFLMKAQNILTPPNHLGCLLKSSINCRLTLTQVAQLHLYFMAHLKENIVQSDKSSKHAWDKWKAMTFCSSHPVSQTNFQHPTDLLVATLSYVALPEDQGSSSFSAGVCLVHAGLGMLA